jgi:mono/diheme cytochrome c family protein
MKLTQRTFVFTALAGAFFLWMGCGSSDQGSATNDNAESSDATAEKAEAEPEGPNKGIGPIINVELGDLDPAMADAGKEIFEANCTTCHKVEDKYIGPPMAGVMDKRTPEWVMNMMLNPEEMVQKDPDAKKLLAEFIAPMANQNLTEEEARKILEYFRTL